MSKSSQSEGSIGHELSGFYTLDSNRQTFNSSSQFLSSPNKSPYDQGTLSVDDYKRAVMADDFEYHDMLGSGGFGFVVKVKKKSTGKFYAMKLQTKMCMLHNTKCLERSMFDELLLHIERSVMAECISHPFITSLHYAFTTTTCAALVMDLASCGTLRQYLYHYKDNDGFSCGLPVGVVKQFVVEIAMALQFLHEHGVIYRDLKPANILLAADGHCLLCDFGLVGKIRERESEVDMGTAVLARDNDTTSINSPSSSNVTDRNISLSSRETSVDDMKSQESDRSADLCQAAPSAGNGLRRIRRRTSCGTVGYRPPEVVRERNLMYMEREGYDESADWFSLGVTTYVLTCAKKPFQNKNNYTAETMEAYEPTSLASDAHEMVPIKPNSNKKPSPTANFEFKTLMSKIDYGTEFSEDQVDFCERLVKRKAENRMTYAELIAHPWIESLAKDPHTLKARPCHPFISDYIREVWPSAHGEKSSDEVETKDNEDDEVDEVDENDSNNFHHPTHSSFPWGISNLSSTSTVSKKPKKKSHRPPRWANFEDLKLSIVKRVRETASEANVEKELRRWNVALADKHDRLFEKWTYVNKKEIEIESLHSTKRTDHSRNTTPV
ncbi:hypothetical protein TrCOL_g10536 [Triparma columacea]|uniref:Protein kinase domain-containing protein n=1 Tax=Triparma columacea TaxID=722753 RepID=A0A9W7LF33_9STRA|nr:hypothetical protein TrCOL_g10536 [Triparma columacea]